MVSRGKAPGSSPQCSSWATTASSVSIIWSILMVFHVSNKHYFTTEAFVVQTVSPASSLPRSSPRHLLLRRQTAFRPLLLGPGLTAGTLSGTWTRDPTTTTTTTTTALAASAGSDERSGKKKRRRKKPPAVPLMDPVKVSSPEPGEVDAIDELLLDEEEPENTALTREDVALIDEIAKFQFQTDKEFSMRGAMLDDDSKTAATSSARSTVAASNAIPLPDIKEARKKKQMEEELARMEQEQEVKKVRIKRSDKEAFARLLEQQPFADADDSLFEEEYAAVSALLGERAKPFLSIPLGPLQVGHFIGALGIVLMAFVEYPGFPLTNLPTPLRECLQGGLGTVYAINTVLAVVAAFKAPERGQPVPLWAIKTFSVGGIAYDQLMQLPTLEEIDRANNVKGKRALKNRKK